MQRDTILFDINETVLDLRILQPLFEREFGGAANSATWFATLLHSSTVCALTGVKTDFKSLAELTLVALAGRIGMELDEVVREEILSNFTILKPYPDVQPALQRLQSFGYQTVAFSNSSENLLRAQLDNAGLAPFFSDIVSVEGSGSFKPDPKVYRFAADILKRPMTGLRLVAAHDWDTHGAMSAGMKAAFIGRSSANYNSVYRKPDIFEKSMTSLVEKILIADE